MLACCDCCLTGVGYCALSLQRRAAPGGCVNAEYGGTIKIHLPIFLNDTKMLDVRCREAHDKFRRIRKGQNYWNIPWQVPNLNERNS